MRNAEDDNRITGSRVCNFRSNNIFSGLQCGGVKGHAPSTIGRDSGCCIHKVFRTNRLLWNCSESFWKHLNNYFRSGSFSRFSGNHKNIPLWNSRTDWIHDDNTIILGSNDEWNKQIWIIHQQRIDCITKSIYCVCSLAIINVKEGVTNTDSLHHSCAVLIEVDPTISRTVNVEVSIRHRVLDNHEVLTWG